MLPITNSFDIISGMNNAVTTHRLKASELVAILQKKIAEVGDLEISVNTQDGGSYSLYSEEDVNIVPWTTAVGSTVKTIEIG